MGALELENLKTKWKKIASKTSTEEFFMQTVLMYSKVYHLKNLI